MASIHFFVEEISFKFSQKRIHRQWIEKAIANENKQAGELNFIFCSDTYLLHINKTFLNHNTLTDIITFPIDSAQLLQPNRAKENTISGEIYISIDRVKENAEKFSTEFHQELKRVLIHGVMHLCGYGDKSPSEAKTMRAKEEFYLKHF